MRMRVGGWGVLISAVGLMPAAWSASPVKMTAITIARQTIGLFERCELTVTVDGLEAMTNPFDPEEVRVEATFQVSREQPVTVEGFYYQPFERAAGAVDGLQPAGEPVWKVRFTPRAPGFWSYQVRLITPEGTQTSKAGTFEVSQSAARGFVHVHPKIGLLWFDRGQPLIPIGENLAWPPTGQSLQAYERWFRELVKQRANFIRVWMAPWSLRLETKETGLGRYDQARAWKLDYLLQESERKGLYWQLCLLNHGAFSRSQDPDWKNNPYNVQVGGMCQVPNDFLTNPEAKAKFRTLVRYLVSRWGYSPNLITWELFNEADLSELKMADFAPWVAEMSQVLRERDVNRRMITTSFHREVLPSVVSLPTIDTIELHLYDRRDFAELFAGSMIPDLQRTYGKPVMVGEFGWITDLVRQVDVEGIHFHDGIWASLMGGAAGSALIWYWDTYIHPNRLQRHFGPLAKFWRGEQFKAPLQRLKLSFSDADLLGCGVGTSHQAYLWIKNRTHNLDQYLAYRCEVAKARIRQERGQPPEPPAPYPPRRVSDATVTVSGLALMGTYRIEWWDPYRGIILATQDQRVWGGRMTIPVPVLAFDVAGKLKKL